ncbi:hypothetical protein ACS0PU_006555 [Formica fusca]
MMEDEDTGTLLTLIFAYRGAKALKKDYVEPGEQECVTQDALSTERLISNHRSIVIAATLWKEGIVESPGRNTPGLRQMLGRSPTFAKIK